MECSGYYYDKLTEQEQKMYQNLCIGLEQFLDGVQFISYTMDWKQIIKVVDQVRYEHPEFYYVDFSGMEFRPGGITQTICPKYRYGYNEMEKVQQKLEGCCADILGRVTGETEYEKELSLHDILIDYVLSQEVDSKIGIDPLLCAPMTDVLFKKGKNLSSSALALAFKYLLNKLSIECIVAYGKVESANGSRLHAWNIVKIEGEYYQVDLTWDMYKSSKDSICHNYFNITDKMCPRCAEVKYPECNSDKYNYYVYNNRVANNK